ncbi:RNA polymerase sigma factor SigV [Pseudidiomarina piscicola]|uniref:RNA polymerase sigma factor SigV n=1 Tax=Pseudidiomarina piscicola TaxID=2614830 RepID=A0A6S6WJP7_9GAMM|nr:RNA polymerase sigma factor [Pseudidiomarina piscicola]CAB0150032.1 RNA polymerase sigma factor SigV [Pseudidiomarina piscicola]VZT39477.1 RNA polymerase sigma factor SigV [Pseudomonas aeruginosa]
MHADAVVTSRMGLINAHYASALMLAQQLLMCPQNAADVVQDATEKALKVSDFPAPERVRTWYLKVVRNRCIDQLRSQRKFIDAQALESLAGAETPTTVSAQTVSGAYSALAALPFELRDLIILRELNECSYKEIAAIVEIPEGTVMSRLHKARVALRNAFNRWQQEKSNEPK